jgi:ribosomal protein S18 acetylase RimI-like enzyme
LGIYHIEDTVALRRCQGSVLSTSVVHSRIILAMEEISIRRASPDDSAGCARLILASAEEFLPAAFGRRIEGVLERLSARGGNLFGAEHTWVATAEGRIAGVLLGYTCGEKSAEDLRTGLALFGLLGLEMAFRFRSLLALRSAIGTLRPGEYYVSNVAVSAETRGKGIGTKLLAKAEEEAREKGCSVIVLDVETENAAAVRLYERLGFLRRSAGPPLRLGGMAFSFSRMEKPLG